MDYGSHGTDRTKYRLDLNRSLYLQSQEYQFIAIPLDEMKENPLFILSMIHTILAPYLAASAKEHAVRIRHQFNKIERQLMRLAVRQNRIVSPSFAAKTLELDKHTIIKHCRRLVDKEKFRAVPTGNS
jgi:transcriptional regulator with GAF, ATPase, and Fis domain